MPNLKDKDNYYDYLESDEEVPEDDDVDDEDDEEDDEDDMFPNYDRDPDAEDEDGPCGPPVDMN